MPINSSILNPRRFVAAGIFSASLALGIASAGAQDPHSGGVSPNTETRDPGAPRADVLGASDSRGASDSSRAGLPFTGSDVAGLAVLGATAITAGTGAVVLSKRRARLSA